LMQYIQRISARGVKVNLQYHNVSYRTVSILVW
jgi:hypothetical protein